MAKSIILPVNVVTLADSILCLVKLSCSSYRGQEARWSTAVVHGNSYFSVSLLNKDCFNINSIIEKG